MNNAPERAMQSAGVHAVDAATLVDEALARARGERADRSTWIATGFHDFDQRVGGLAPGSLTVLGARPGIGKTSWANTVAAHVMRSDTPGGVLTYAPAASPDTIMLGMLSLVAKVDRRRIRDGALRPDDEPRVAAAAAQLRRPGRLFIADACAHSVDDLCAQARTVAPAGDGLQLVIVDALDALSDELEPARRDRDLERVLRELKQLAVELDVAVLALARVKPTVDARPDPRPGLRDLHAAEAAQRHADIVATLFRADYYMLDETPVEWQGKAELSILQNRFGNPGSTILGFVARYGRFVDLDGVGSTIVP